ncbi:MAG: ABC transporter permease [Burkholderiaceae bacterium]|nr:ABC transporter permease [Burkholderiaceae bacterium]
MPLSLLGGVWRYRGFVVGSIVREFQSKYRNSLLGAAWTVLNPLAMIVVYTVIFSRVMGSRLAGSDTPFAYSIYLCAGALTWGLFAEITGRSLTMFLENANLIKKLQFPRICLPVVVVLNAGINFAIIFGLFTLFLLVSGNFPGLVFLALIPVLLLLVLFGVGLGMVLGVLNVFFRDVGQFFTILLQFWFWFTPIVYPASALPPEVRAALAWNPMTALIGACQAILVEGRAPQWASLLPVLLLGLGFSLLGLHLFRRRSGEMADEL